MTRPELVAEIEFTDAELFEYTLSVVGRPPADASSSESTAAAPSLESSLTATVRQPRFHPTDLTVEAAWESAQPPVQSDPVTPRIEAAPAVVAPEPDDDAAAIEDAFPAAKTTVSAPLTFAADVEAGVGGAASTHTPAAAAPPPIAEAPTTTTPPLPTSAPADTLLATPIAAPPAPTPVATPTPPPPGTPTPRGTTPPLGSLPATTAHGAPAPPIRTPPTGSMVPFAAPPRPEPPSEDQSVLSSSPAPDRTGPPVAVSAEVSGRVSERRTPAAPTVAVAPELAGDELIEEIDPSPFPARAAVPPPPPPALPALVPPPLPSGSATAADAGRRKRQGKQWFEEIFDEDYLRTLPLLTPQQTEREASFIVESLNLQPAAAVLDVGCGYGRHALELATRGHDVTGLDLSLPLLIRAADATRRAGVTVNFIHGDMREMTFEAEFDAAYCVFTTFGFFDETTNRHVTDQIARALKPGGRFLLDVVNRDYLIGDLPTRVWWQGDGCVVLEEVDFNFFTSRVQSHRSVVFEDGRQLEQDISIRAYSLHEIGRILHRAGFKVIEVSGGIGMRGRFYGTDCRQVLVVAEKKA